MRFRYTTNDPSQSELDSLPRVPLTLNLNGKSVKENGLVDSGCTPEAWYSVVTEMKTVGSVVNETEANTKESLNARFWKDCRRHQGVVCMKISTQE